VSEDYSAVMGLEPRGGNLYRPHTLQCNSGEFWRCAHGRTGFGAGMEWIGCDECAQADPEAFARGMSPEALAVDDYWRRAFHFMTQDYRGGTRQGGRTTMPSERKRPWWFRITTHPVFTAPFWTLWKRRNHGRLERP
jgi:hypothetical protein